MRLSDAIEDFIKMMLNNDENDREIELKRNELAEYFSCAPSQINYVLSTRFTPDHGYIIKSTRGGGGCIRIYRMQEDMAKQFPYIINERIGDSISKIDAQHIISHLLETETISQNESRIMNSAIDDRAISIPITAALKDKIRAKILSNMLSEIALR